MISRLRRVCLIEYSLGYQMNDEILSRINNYYFIICYLNKKKHPVSFWKPYRIKWFIALILFMFANGRWYVMLHTNIINWFVVLCVYMFCGIFKDEKRKKNIEDRSLHIMYRLMAYKIFFVFFLLYVILIHLTVLKSYQWQSFLP